MIRQRAMSFAGLALAIVSAGLAGCASTRTVAVVDGMSWRPSATASAARAADCVRMVVLGTTGPDEQTRAALRRALLNARYEALETRALMLADVGIAATHAGDLEVARTALDGALQITEAVIYDPAKSREIASLSGEERTKIFKGEPYERALCNLYRGLIYLADGEYDSARACFMRADMYTAGGGPGQWLSLEQLAAVADALSPNSIGLRQDIEIPDGLQADPYRSDEDTLVIVMSGACPSKLHHQGGKQHGLTYGQVHSDIATVRIATADAEARLAAHVPGLPIADRPVESSGDIVVFHEPTEDVFLQAVSNGRREVDKLLAAKQRSAEVGRGVGDAAETLAAATMMVPYAGYAFFLVGALSRGASAGADSTADLRSITGPGFLYLATLQAGGQELAVHACNSAGSVMAENTIPVPRARSRAMHVVVARVYR